MNSGGEPIMDQDLMPRKSHG